MAVARRLPPRSARDALTVEPRVEIRAARATRAASLYGVGSLLVQGLTLVVYVVLARLAGPEAFGIFAAAMILVGVGSLFGESGMLAALVQRRDRIDEAAATATVATLLAGVALALIAFALSPGVGAFFDSRTAGLVAAAASGLLVVNGAGVVPSALLQRRIAVLGRQLSELGAVAAMGVVGTVALLAGLGVWALLLGSYAFAVTRTLSLWIAARWWPDRRLVSVSMWRELVGYGRHVLLGSALAEVGRVVSTALVGRLLGAVALGHFRFGLRVVIQGAAPLLLSASYVLFPAFSEIGGDDARFRQALLRSVRMLSLVAFPVSLLFVPLGVPVAVVLLGEAWLRAGQVMMALAGVAMGMTLISISSDAFKARRRPDLLPRMHAVGAVLPVVLMFPLVSFGPVGVAAAMSIGALGTAAYALRLLASVSGLRLREILRALVPAGGAAVTMAVVLLLLDRLVIDVAEREVVVGASLLVLEVALALAFYLAVLRIVAPRALEDVRLAAKALRRRDRSQPGPPVPRGTETLSVGSRTAAP
jgi:O-antigen/teichoic acid export membrane protein